jgi:hypothetical protein
MATRYRNRHAIKKDFDTAIPLEKRIVDEAIANWRRLMDTHPWMTIVKGRNAVRKARKQELLGV